MGSNPSLDSITEAVKQRGYRLVVDRAVSGGARQKTWSAKDPTGNFSLIVTQSDVSSPGRVMCAVTLPTGTESGVEQALIAPSQFGVPDTRQRRGDGSDVMSWVRRFDWGTAEVNLTTRISTLSRESLLSIVYQLK